MPDCDYPLLEELNDMLDCSVMIKFSNLFTGFTQGTPTGIEVRPRCTQHVQLNSRTKTLDLHNFLFIDLIDVLLSHSSSIMHKLSIPHRFTT